MTAEARELHDTSDTAKAFVFSDTHADAAAGIFVAWAQFLAGRGHRILFAHPAARGRSASRRRAHGHALRARRPRSWVLSAIVVES